MERRRIRRGCDGGGGGGALRPRSEHAARASKGLVLAQQSRVRLHESVLCSFTKASPPSQSVHTCMPRLVPRSVD
eukprot:2913433-Pleurochrysis_carterae.AAC.1